MKFISIQLNLRYMKISSRVTEGRLIWDLKYNKPLTPSGRVIRVQKPASPHAGANLLGRVRGSATNSATHMHRAARALGMLCVRTYRAMHTWGMPRTPFDPWSAHDLPLIVPWPGHQDLCVVNMPWPGAKVLGPLCDIVPWLCA